MIKKYWKQFISLFIIASASATGLGAFDTNYRVKWHERFSVLDCRQALNIYQCNKDFFLETVKRSPENYPNYEIDETPEKDFEVWVWKEYTALTDARAKLDAKALAQPMYAISTVEQKTSDDWTETKEIKAIGE